MDITAIRFANYEELRKRFRQMEDEQGIPERGELNRFGKLTGISAPYLSHINCRRKEIGHQTARQLEEAFNLEHGWMDTDHIGGAIPMDARAKDFGNLAMRLYMADPEGTRAALMEYMEKKIFS